MRVISSEGGRVLRFFAPEEFRPERGIYVPAMLSIVRDKFGFVSHSTPQEAMEQGAVFKNGTVQIGDDRILLAELGVFNDGLLVESATTDAAERALDFVLDWAVESFGYRRPQLKAKRFRSMMVVELDARFDQALRGFKKISAALSSSIADVYGADVEFSLAEFALGIDPVVNPPTPTFPALVEFTVQRRLATPHSKNRFFSVAPLPTEAHQALLETLEDAFG